jgi:hypothetical protein
MKKMVALIAVAAAVGLAPRDASAQSLVTCESKSGDRQICRVDTGGGVTIRQQLSSTSCVQGRNWGYSRTAIWVDNGCRAQFLVNTRGRYNDGNNNGGYNNGGYNNNNGQYNNDNRNVNSAAALCRRAVRSQLGRRVEVSTWNMNNSRNNARVGWRLANGRSGECRFDRSGNVSVLVNRNRG